MRNDKDPHEILKDAENVFVDFGYPFDMNSFIGYMPVEDSNYTPSEHTQEENEHKLIENLNKFLENEKKSLGI